MRHADRHSDDIPIEPPFFAQQESRERLFPRPSRAALVAVVHNRQHLLGGESDGGQVPFDLPPEDVQECPHDGECEDRRVGGLRRKSPTEFPHSVSEEHVPGKEATRREYRVGLSREHRHLSVWLLQGLLDVPGTHD